MKNATLPLLLASGIALLTPVHALTIAELNLDAAVTNEVVPEQRSRELPLTLPTRVIAKDLDSVTVEPASGFDGVSHEKLIVIRKQGGPETVSVTWKWSPFVVPEDGTLVIKFRLFLSAENQQGNFMIGVHDSTDKGIVAYLQIAPGGKLSMLDTSIPDGRPNPIGKLRTDGTPNLLKIVINYKTSETSVWLNKEPLRQSLSFDPVHRANQLIFYVPSPKASRTVGLDGVWIGTGDEEPVDEGSR